MGAGRRGDTEQGRHGRLRRDTGLSPDTRTADHPRPSGRRGRPRCRVSSPGSDRVRRRRGRERPRARIRAPRPRRLPHLSRRAHAAAAPLLAARAAPAARWAGRARARGRNVNDTLAELFRRHLCQTSSAPLGITVARASGSTIWDDTGRPYLDLLAGMGVANVGHTRPEVVAAVRAQAERHLQVLVYGELVQEPQVRLAARLVSLLPPPLDVVYFTSSGAEAVEGALKAARKPTG